jgi:hypothetical protein
MKKAASWFLISIILLLSGNMFAKERKGAELIIQKTDGTQVRGELIAVKENSILLLEWELGADVSVVINETSTIKIVKKQNTAMWGGIGSLFGLITGAAIGSSISIEKRAFMGADITEVNRAYNTLMGMVAGGVLGFAAGALTGAATGTDKTIRIEGRSETEIQEILEQLRKKARIKNYQ